MSDSKKPKALGLLDVYLDGANLDDMEKAAPWIGGFTTNPSLLKAAGVKDYRRFAACAVDIAGKRPISFEVFADDPLSMLAEARELASWGPSVYVKIPIVNTLGGYNVTVVRQLLDEGIKVNVTAIMTLTQISFLKDAIKGTTTPMIASVFAGRVADTGEFPAGPVRDASTFLYQQGNVKVLWASARQVFDVKTAIWCGADIITLTPALIAKIPMLGKDLGALTIETVQQFHRDGVASGLAILPRVLS